MAMSHVCPWWFAYTFDNALRKLFHNPKKMLASYLREGMSALDIGCGMGFFSIGMARLVGDRGSVTAIDLQEEMLRVVQERAEEAGVGHTIQYHHCGRDHIGVHEKANFILAFWMLHEVPNERTFLTEIHSLLKPRGIFLLAEPKIHVSIRRFKEMVEFAKNAGLCPFDRPNIRLSHSMVFKRCNGNL
jgi:2-polyprenyl-3-methyl-5-hydroxy-6-metoxy-1,4-benzoquinol methylase